MKRKAFTHVPFPDLGFEYAAETNDYGNRVYHVFNDGRPVGSFPSVTTVLGASGKEFLNEWREQIGEEEADLITSKATRTGTSIHDCAERYLKNQEVFAGDEPPGVKYQFKEFKATLDRIDNIKAQEIALHSTTLGLAGRVDCVAEFDGVLSIIDFKTSRKMKIEEWIQDYYAQCAAYAYMIYELYGIMIKQIVIPISVANGFDQVFVEKPMAGGYRLQEAISLYNQR